MSDVLTYCAGSPVIASGAKQSIPAARPGSQAVGKIGARGKLRRRLRKTPENGLLRRHSPSGRTGPLLAMTVLYERRGL
jgi:hypothetical protein